MASPPEVAEVWSPAPDAGAARALETHISWLFLVGDRAYKLKKPVHLDFLDFSTREGRAVACRREVELNRRLAPDVYLGVADVHGADGKPCDHLVVMRRMPEDRRLAALVERGEDVDGDVRDVARLLAAFHARADTSPEISATGTVAAVRARWESSFATMAPFYGVILDEEVARRLEDRVRRYLAGRQPLFAERMANGEIRDGHGDLLADDIYCLDDGPRVLDCIEFDDTLRYGDVISDVAFLAMDLERLGAVDLAARFLAWYREFTADHAPGTLIEHYVAYRAHVRAKVACMRYEQGDESSAADADALLRLAGAHAERTRVALALVGGLPGTGKSTLAGEVADRLGWSVVRSDEVRKDIAGVGHADRGADGYGAGLYSRAMTTRTYAELLRRARTLLEHGESVLLDASWSDPESRAEAFSLARDAGADLHQLRCTAPETVTATRIAARLDQRGDPSDATVEVARRMAVDAPSWDDATEIDTSVAQVESVESALRALTVEVLDAP